MPGTPKPLERNRHKIIQPKGGAAYVSNYLPTASRNEQAVIRDFARQAMQNRIPFAGAIDLRIVVFRPVPASWSAKRRAAACDGTLLPITKPDFDNYGKMVDALKSIVWRDDAQVCRFFFWKVYSETPELVMEIRPIN